MIIKGKHLVVVGIIILALIYLFSSNFSVVKQEATEQECVDLWRISYRSPVTNRIVIAECEKLGDFDYCVKGQCVRGVHEINGVRGTPIITY